MSEVVRNMTTRMEKYKDLRDGINEEVSIKRQPIQEIIEEDDDFLSFLPEDVLSYNLEDTLNEPLSYENLNQDEDIQEAINEAKKNVGKSRYNTRMDILNKIRNEENKEDDDYSQGHVVDSNKKESLLEKLAAMSPEEDVEELKEFEKSENKGNDTDFGDSLVLFNDLVEEEKQQALKEEEEAKAALEAQKEEEKKEKKRKKKAKKEKEPKEKKDKESILMTVLNVILGVLIVVLIFVIILFAKQWFFGG